MHRYAWCLNLVAGKEVLDIACGEGFGSALLARQARSVVGVDIAPDAIAHARHRYPADNLSFIEANASQLPLADQCADIVVSFETIEHLAEQEQFIAEIRRVLRPHGYLIMSSPNIDVYTVRQNHKNRFHVKELTRQEFSDLLLTQFPAVQMFGQRLAVASTILGDALSPDIPTQLLRDGAEVTEGFSELPATMYFIAAAAAAEDDLPRPSATVLLSDDYDAYWDMRDSLASQKHENEELSDELKRSQQEVAGLSDELKRSQQEVAGLSDELRGSQQEVAARNAELAHLRLPALLALAISGGLFDARHYRAAARLPKMSLLELFNHYITEGEAAGLTPSRRFDPVFYRTTYPDVAEAGVGLLEHYVLVGGSEGRKTTHQFPF
jgi:SAM-dependent methyltransferase